MRKYLFYLIFVISLVCVSAFQYDIETTGKNFMVTKYTGVEKEHYNPIIYSDNTVCYEFKAGKGTPPGKLNVYLNKEKTITQAIVKNNFGNGDKQFCIQAPYLQLGENTIIIEEVDNKHIDIYTDDNQTIGSAYIYYDPNDDGWNRTDWNQSVENLQVEVDSDLLRYYWNHTGMEGWNHYFIAFETPHQWEWYGTDQIKIIMDEKNYTHQFEVCNSREWNITFNNETNETTYDLLNEANCQYETFTKDGLNYIATQFYSPKIIDPTLSSSSLTEDVNGVDTCGPGVDCNIYQMKWDVSSLSGTVNDAMLCLYINSVVGTISDVNVSYVTDQTWVESITAAGMNGQTYTNWTVETLNQTGTAEYGCFNVTTQMQEALSSSHSNMTILVKTVESFEPVSIPLQQYTSKEDGTTSPVGAEASFAAQTGFNVDTREGTNKPYLDYDISDETPPTQTLLFPTNNTYYNYNFTDVNITCSDSSGVNYSWYSLDNGETNTTPVAGCQNITTYINNLGENNLTHFSNDSLGNEAEDYYVWFYDPTTTSVTLVSPPDAQSNTTGTHSYNATMIDNLNLKNATFEIWDSSNNLVKNYTIDITGTSNATNYTYTLSLGGTYKWNYYVCDQASNCNYATSNFTITYADPSLSLTWVNPTKNSNIVQNASNNLTLNLTCIGGDCGDINTTLYFDNLSASPYQTTSLTDGDLQADVSYWTGAMFQPFATFQKINITSITNDVDVASICYYISSKVNSPSSTVNVSLIKNQTWEEGTVDYTINDIAISNSTLSTMTNTTATQYFCANATLQLKEAISLGYDNLTLRISINGVNPQVSGVIDDTQLRIGADGSGAAYYLLEDREGNRGTSNYPILTVIEDLGAVEPIIINTTTGNIPYYTTSNQSQTYNLLQDESVLITWFVNATGEMDLTNEFYVVANRSEDQSDDILSERLNLTIAEEPTEPEVSYVDPTRADSSSENNVSVYINVTILEPNLTNVVYNFNGTNYSSIYNESLVLMMNFDNYTGFNDTSLYQNNAECTNCPALTTGKHGQAYYYDGINDRLNMTVPAPSELLFADGDWTISAWINNTETIPAGDEMIIQQGAGGAGNSRYSMRVAQAGYFYISIDDNTALVNSHAYQTNVSDSNWHHVVAMRSGNDLKVFVDGVLENSTDITGYGSLDDTEGVYIGSTNANSLYFNGTIDELKLWNRSLSDQEVYIDYASNFKKINSTNWNFYINQSENATTNLSNANYTYYVCAIDTYPSEVCLSERSIELTNSTNTNPPQISNLIFYALNSSQGVVGNDTYFKTENLDEIEYLMINFTLTDETGISGDPVLYFTAAGSNSCAVGNNQSTVCYNLTENTWIEFRNGTSTSTFKDEGAIGDFINLTYIGSATERNYTIIIDEHYNPNVFKWYNASYNFSDVKWQDDTLQRIKGNNYIRINLQGVVPLTADDYKLDFRVQTTGTPDQLQAYACNATYSSGDPELNSNCILVAEKTSSELQDDGTKFRAEFTRELVDQLGIGKYIILKTDSKAASSYYAIKTYKITNPGHTQQWEYSTDSGDSWTNLADGYETEMNINWFYNGGDPTAFVFKVQANDTEGNIANTSNYNYTWDINPTNNYPPLISISEPNVSDILTGVINITWNSRDPNNNNLSINISLNSTVVATVQPNDGNYTLDTSLYDDAYYNLIVTIYENDTADGFSRSDSHLVGFNNTGTLDASSEEGGSSSGAVAWQGDAPYLGHGNVSYVADQLVNGANTFFDRLTSKFKESGNNICDDGENPLQDKNECQITLESINCDGDRCIFKEIWFAKVLLIIATVMIFWYKKDYQIFLILIGVILAVNFFGVLSLDSTGQSVSSTETIYSPGYDGNYLMVIGNKIWPSNPEYGMYIFLVGIGLSAYYFFNYINVAGDSRWRKRSR